MKKILLMITLSLLATTSSVFAGIHDEVQYGKSYYTDSERTVGKLVFTRTHTSPKEVHIKITRNTGGVIKRKVGHQQYTFSDLHSEIVILDFQDSMELQEGDTQEISIDFAFGVKLSNLAGIKVTGASIIDNGGAPHKIDIDKIFPKLFHRMAPIAKIQLKQTK
jgi:uncharacterized protein YdeI (BOF family)